MKPLDRSIRDQLIHHQAWRRSLPWGHRANLGGANLQDANLRDANLRGAIVASDGKTLEQYMEWLPTLLTAGGKTVEEVASHWDCHTWSNCPMHAAFDAVHIIGVPRQWQTHAGEFICLFDAGVIPRPNDTLDKQEDR